MKLRLYKLLFHVFSFLSDKTNGANLFVKYKILLGTVIIGLIGVACSSKNSQSQVMCYEVIAPDSVVIPDNDSDTLPAITNYEIITEVSETSRTEEK